MPGMLEDGIRRAMSGEAKPQVMGPAPSNPDDPLAGLQDASDEDEAYVDDVWRVVASRLYTDRAAEQIARTVERAPEQIKPQALIQVSKVYMDAANEAMRNMSVEPPEGADHQITDMIVDAVLEIADESGAMPYSDELATTVLVGARDAFIKGHPELYGEQNDGGLQSQPGPIGSSGRGSGLSQVRY